MDFFKLISLTLLSCQFSLSAPKELKTKQSYDYIRYLSSDGKTSYYQNKKGELIYSSFYNTKVILQFPPLTQYQVQVDQNYMLALVSPNFFQVGLTEQNLKIYVSQIGQEPVLYGEGLYPRLHSSVKKLSYYNKDKNEIIIQDLESKAIISRIKLRSKKEYIRAIDIMFISKNDIIYSDINSNQEKAYIYFSFIDEKSKLMFKSASSQYRLEACLINKKLFVGQFPISNLDLSTEIISIDLFNNKNFTDYKQVYSSSLPDLGNIICREESIYFIKTFNRNRTLRTLENDLVKLNTTSKAIERISNIKTLNNAFEMDKLILTFQKGKYYILDGNQILDDKLDGVKK